MLSCIHHHRLCSVLSYSNNEITPLLFYLKGLINKMHSLLVQMHTLEKWYPLKKAREPIPIIKQWGRGTMQHDITDGVQWLIQEGIADPNRIAIYGGSYGGYATLAGLTFTPDLFAAGISYVGPSNLFTLFASIPPYWEPIRQVMYEQIGNPDTEKDFVESISPFFYADQIKVPLLVVQGANDPRVKKAESDQIVQALRQRNIAVPYMVKDNEGHGFRNQENQFDFYRVMEAFLAQYLLGRSSTDIAILKPLEEAS
jgi:dipeptidyl aminopeptidase/acylaminoacyl peptidase